MDSPAVVNEAIVLPERWWGGNGRAYHFRSANPLDRETIIANINAIGAENIYLPSNRYVPTPAWEAVLNGSIINDTRSLLAVVEMGGFVVGHGRLFPEGFGHKDKHVVDVGMGLLKPYRSLGIGTALLAYLLQWAKQAGYQKMTATMLSSNIRAQRLFARHCFRQEGMRVRQFMVGDEYVDELLVARFL